jgi:tetratricopeptide (TPR) repeat protein
MCKPSLVALPPLLLLLDFWPLRRFAPGVPAGPGQSWKELLWEKVPFFLLALGAAVVTLRMQADEGAFTLNLPLSARLANAFVSIPRYLGKFFWPFNLTVCYPHPGHWPAVGVGAAVALVLAITGAALWQARRRPWLLVGWGWFLVMLAPVLGVVQAGFQAMADRYTYLPILGLQLALLSTLPGLAWSFVARSAWTGFVGLLLAGCAVRTWVQAGTWRDPHTLFEHALAVTERNDMAHYFLGATLLAEGRADEAECHVRRAIEINPDYAADHDLLARI